jgi:hypothetical protein
VYKSIELPSFIIDVTGNPATAKLVPRNNIHILFHEMKRHTSTSTNAPAAIEFSLSL